jgi:hypothetical protein
MSSKRETDSKTKITDVWKPKHVSLSTQKRKKDGMTLGWHLGHTIFYTILEFVNVINNSNYCF